MTITTDKVKATFDSRGGTLVHLELLGYRHPRGRTNPPTGLTAVGADRLAWQAGKVDMLLDALTDSDFIDAVLARAEPEPLVSEPEPA